MVETTDGEPEQYWYNTKTGLVEKGRLTAALNRIGPFETREEAENALEIVRTRAKQWRDQEQDES